MSRKAVIFDLGGVLVQYDHERTITSIAAISNADPGLVGRSLRDVSDLVGAGEMDNVDLHRYLVEYAGVTQDYQAFDAASCAGIGRDEAAMRNLAALQEVPSLALGIISNTVESHTRWLRANLPELEQFEAVVFSNEVGLLKPDATIYRLALERLALEPDQALFVDDRGENVEAAEKLGMAAIQHQDWGTTPETIQAWLAGS